MHASQWAQVKYERFQSFSETEQQGTTRQAGSVGCLLMRDSQIGSQMTYGQEDIGKVQTATGIEFLGKQMSELEFILP